MDMNIDEFLYKRKMPRDDFARLVGVSRQTIDNISRGLKQPRLGTAKKIQEASRGAIRVEDLLSPEKIKRGLFLEESKREKARMEK